MTTECVLRSPVGETNMLPLASRISPVEDRLRTISSTVPISYERRVRFSDPVRHSNSSDCLASEQPGKTTAETIMNGEKKEATKPTRPLAQIEPLAVANLREIQKHASSQDKKELALKSLTMAAHPRIEIRLRRPTSLNNISRDVTASTVEELSKDVEKKDVNTGSPSIKRVNRWLFAKKLTRFASSPSLFNYGDNNNKVETDALGSQSRERCDSNATNSSGGSPAETRKSQSDFLSRLKKRKAKGSSLVLNDRRSKPIHIEVFNNYDIKDTNFRAADLQDFDTVDLDNVDADKVKPSTSSTREQEHSLSVVPKAEKSSTNVSPAHALISSINSMHSDSGIKAHLMHHFICELPCNGSSTLQAIVKDATNVQPLRDGNILITDILSNKMLMFDHHGLPKVGFTLDEASEPWAACLTSDGTLAVTLRRQGCVSLWSLSGLPLTEFGKGNLIAPTGIQVDSLDRFAVTDEKLNTVSIFTRRGQFLLTFMNPQVAGPSSSTATLSANFHFNQPRYVCVTNDGHYVVSDSANHCLRIFDSNGNFSHSIGSFGHKDGHFRFPYGVAYDNTGAIYVADHFNHRISVFSFEGVFQHHALTSEDGITRPKGLAIHNSHLYVTYGELRAGKISVFNISSRQLTLAANTSSTSTSLTSLTSE